MRIDGIIVTCFFASILIGLTIFLIIKLIQYIAEMRINEAIEKHKNENHNLYFTFNSDDEKIIKAFRIVIAKNVNISDFIECSERFTEPLLEYNKEHRSLSKDEFNLLKEVLSK